METVVLIIPSFIAAFLGTILMTLSQESEMRILKRPISHSPGMAVFQMLNLDFESLREWQKNVATYAVHFLYGTLWGFPIAFLFFFGITTFGALLVLHYLIVLIQGWVVLVWLGIAGSPWTWGAKWILLEMFHKFIYSFATVYFFFAFL